jgi:hypothetical protein
LSDELTDLVCVRKDAPTSIPFGLDPDARERVVPVLDKLNARYGLNTVYLGSIHSVRKEAPTSIPFGPPPPLEEFDDPADKERIIRKGR